jgi:hypothetical protein
MYFPHLHCIGHFPFLLLVLLLHDDDDKVEESPVEARDVLNTCYRVAHPDKPPLTVGLMYFELQESLVNCELLVLRVLSFQVDKKKETRKTSDQNQTSSPSIPLSHEQ